MLPGMNRWSDVMTVEKYQKPPGKSWDLPGRVLVKMLVFI